MTDPIILDAFELWSLRAFEQGDEATGMMLSEIGDGYAAGFTPEANARIAINSARKRLDPKKQTTNRTIGASDE